MEWGNSSDSSSACRCPPSMIIAKSFRWPKKGSSLQGIYCTPWKSLCTCTREATTQDFTLLHGLDWNFFFFLGFLHDTSHMPLSSSWGLGVVILPVVRGGYPLNNYTQLPVNKAEQRDNIIGSQRVPPTPATSLRHLSPDSHRKTLKSAYWSNKETKRLIHIKHMIRLPASYYVNLITGWGTYITVSAELTILPSTDPSWVHSSFSARRTSSFFTTNQLRC